MQQSLHRRTLSRYALAFALSFALIASSSLFIVLDAQARVRRVTICHHPPGNPDRAREITIPVNALPAHIANHGDTIGACDADPGPEPGPGPGPGPRPGDDPGFSEALAVGDSDG